MKVNVLSDTKQEFNGEVYYLCGDYFQHKGKRLHREVWKAHYGDIPKGKHVHHKDGNKANNAIENLILLDAAQHVSYHGKLHDRYEYEVKHISEMQDLAKEWHASEEGRKWHSEHAKEAWASKEYVERTCTQCGKVFQSKGNYSSESNTFCSNKCKTAYRFKMGYDNEERICEYCGKVFVKNKYAKAKCCSYECAVKRGGASESRQNRICWQDGRLQHGS